MPTIERKPVTEEWVRCDNCGYSKKEKDVDYTQKDN